MRRGGKTPVSVMARSHAAASMARLPVAKSDLTMYLCKTDKARAELTARSRTLSQRERAALLMADGTRTRNELRVLLQFEDGLVEGLIAACYLQVGAGPDPDNVNRVAPPRAPQPVALLAPVATPVATHSADNFDGKRSLATTRMFLFDIGERMFSRRQPERAALFRDQLREARDRHSMLAVSREMISAVEEMAGHERADSLSERIAMLLPPEV